MDYTSRMVALLRELRRERNGAVADSMRYYGTPYGLNYGVSLPTLRRIARAEAPDHGFARYLYRQDVRELRLAALHIACPACFTPEEFPAWAAGIVNSEIAEEAAFALLSRAEAFPALFSAWIASPDALLQYAALLAAARSPRLTASWVAPAKPCTAMQRLRRRSKRRPKRRPRRPPPQFLPLRIPLLHRVPLSLIRLLRRPLLRKLPRLLPAILPLT